MSIPSTDSVRANQTLEVITDSVEMVSSPGRPMLLTISTESVLYPLTEKLLMTSSVLCRYIHRNLAVYEQKCVTQTFLPNFYKDILTNFYRISFAREGLMQRCLILLNKIKNKIRSNRDIVE